MLTQWHLGHRPSLDAVRGIAILGVLASHFEVPGLRGAGSVGVALFFALSGYLITGILLEGIDLRRFYARRIRRLLPALIVLLVIVGAWSLLLGRGPAYLDDARSVLLYVGNWSLLSGQPLVALGHTWSLAIEEQFYIAWPVILWLSLRIGVRAAIAVAIAGIALSFIAGFAFTSHVFIGSDARAKDLLMGCLIALLSRHFGRDIAPRTWIAALAAVALAGLVMTPDEGTALFTGLPCAVIVAWAAARPDWLARRPLTWTGRISYGLYLYHYPLTVNPSSAFHGFDALPLWPRIAALVGTSYAMAAASWYGIERRFLRSAAEKPVRDRQAVASGTPFSPAVVGAASLE